MTDHAFAVWRKVRFRKSSFSGSTGGNCVEVAWSGTRFGVRDSKNPIGAVLAMKAEQGQTLLLAIKGDELTR